MTVSGFTIHSVSRFVTMSLSKHRKISLKTLKEKYETIKKLESGCTNKNVAADYDVSPSTLSTWLKSKDKIVKAFEGGTSLKTQKLKPCGNENLEQPLYTWFVQMRRQGVPVSGPVLRELLGNNPPFQRFSQITPFVTYSTLMSLVYFTKP